MQKIGLNFIKKALIRKELLYREVINYGIVYSTWACVDGGCHRDF